MMLGKLIRERRLALGLTQEELANKAGVTKNYLTMVERGDRKNVHFLVRVALAHALGIPVLEVVTPEEEPQLEFLVSSITLQQAELVVWSLTRCIRAGEKPAVSSKFGAQLALQRVAAEYPERREELQAIRTRLNELFRQRDHDGHRNH